MSTYPAITIWQPWASLIAESMKTYEFRSWAFPTRMIGQRVAIHASARPVRRDEVQGLIYVLMDNKWRENGIVDRDRALALLERVLQAPKSLPLSSIICLATLGTPIRDAALSAAIQVAWQRGGEHTNYGWPLSDIERLEPFVPAKGAQGWWTWVDTRTGAK